MKQPRPLLRFSTLTFFAIMVAGPVLYQCGIFKRHQPHDTQVIATKPYIGSIAFENELQHMAGLALPSSKSGIPLPLTKLDTQIVMEILEMRYFVSQFNETEKAEFQQAYLQTSAIKKDWEWGRWRTPYKTQDSLDALPYAKAGLAGLSHLNKAEVEKFNTLFDNYAGGAERRMKQYIRLSDTIQVLRKFYAQ